MCRTTISANSEKMLVQLRTEIGYVLHRTPPHQSFGSCGIVAFLPAPNAVGVSTFYIESTRARSSVQLLPSYHPISKSVGGYTAYTICVATNTLAQFSNFDFN